jgi:hypothetical protein
MSQRVQAAPAQVVAVSLRKTVGTTPDVCAKTTEATVAPGSTVYLCYTLTNSSTSTVAVEPLDLIDDFDTSSFQPVNWERQPGFLLQPGQTLTPTVANGLIRPVVVSATQSTLAGWGIVSADGSLSEQVRSNPVTITTVSLGMSAALGVGLSPGTTSNCSSSTATVSLYSNPAYFCVTLTNQSSISLTEHLISIPGFSINNVEVTKTVGPAGSGSAIIQITSSDNPAMGALLRAPTISSRAYVTSANASGSLSVTAVTDSVVVNGPAASVQLIKTVNTDPSCSTFTSLNSVPFGQTFYYCAVLINNSVVTFTNHTLTEPGLNINGSFGYVLAPSTRYSVTNNILTSTLGLPPIFGPFQATTIINSTMTYTASNPILGYRAVSTSSTSVNIITPTPTVTRGPTATNTPIAFATPTPTPSLTPIPATPTPTWTWTPSPTFTPPPTVLAFSTPGGLAPTPYPPIPGVQNSVPGNPFNSPLDPFGATLTAQAFGFPTPVLDPFGATMTAQAFGFPTPVLDPFGATLTAQAQFGFPTPVLDPFGATLTAQAFGFPTPVLDPFGATLTAQAQFGIPTPLLDPFGATMTAQAVSPLSTPTTAEIGMVQPGLVITVTATPTPEPIAGPTQRPLEPPTPGPTADRRFFFATVLDSAGTTLVLLWFLGGSVLFFVTAGVLAGLAFRDKERSRYELDPQQEKAFTTETPQPPDDQNWPTSLP